MGLVKNTTYYTVGTVLPKVGSFIFLPIYLKYLTPGEYGIITSLLVLNGVLSITFSLSLPRALYRVYYDYKTADEKRILIGTVIISVLTFSFIQFGLLNIFHHQVEKIYPSIKFYPFYFLSILSVLMTSLQTIPQSLLQIKEKALTFISLSTSFFFLKNLLILFMIVFQKKGVIGYLQAEIISDSLLLLIYFIVIRNDISLRWDYKVFRNVIFFSLPILPGILSAWVLNLSDRIFIARYYTTYDVGIYSLGYQIAGLVLLFTSAFKSAYDPYFFKIANTKSRDEAVQTLYKTNNVFLLVLIIFSFCIAFFSKEAIFLFFNENYYSAHLIVPIVSLGYLFSQNSALLNTMVYQEKKTKVIMYITLISALINIVLNFILIPRYGMYGAAVVTLISFIIVFALTYQLAKRYYFVPYNWKMLIPILFLCLFVYVSFEFVDIKNILYTLILKVMIVTAFFFFFGYKYKTILLSILGRK